MTKKMTTILLILIVLIIFCVNLKAYGLSNPAEENAGYALLDSVFVTFKELAAMKEPVLERTQNALKEMMRDAKNARSQDQIDDAFFERFHRILLVLNIVITPVEKDEAGIMAPLYFGEINRFIEDIEGEKYDVQKAGGHEAINKLSQAISHEIIDLRLYLDTKEKREQLMEQYDKQIGLDEASTSPGTDRAKQLTSLRKMTFVNQAMTDYMTDFGAPPEQSGTYTRGGEFDKALSPFYIKTLPIQDDWEGRYFIYSGKSGNGVYEGISGCTEKDILIVSYGRDGKKENWRYDPNKPEAGLYEPKTGEDYDKDIVLWNGNWIRAPRIVKKQK
jgi:hypothetical protein